MVKDCSYDKPSEMVRDRIVAGILSQDIREKLLTEGDALTMDKAIELAVTYETTQQCLQSMATSATPTSVDAIKQKRQRHPGNRNVRKTREYNTGIMMSSTVRTVGDNTTTRMPSIWSGMQELSHVQPLGKDVPQAKVVYSINNDDDPPLFIDSITNGVKHPDTAFAFITTSTGKDIRFKIDTGSQVNNVIPASVYEKMREAPPLRPSSSKVFSYSGQRLPVTGDITMECQYKECSYTGVFHIVDTPPASQPILDLPACLQLKVIQLVLSVDSDSTLPQNESLLTKNTVIEEYKHLFSGLGDLEGKITIHLKETLSNRD